MKRINYFIGSIRSLYLFYYYFDNAIETKNEFQFLFIFGLRNIILMNCFFDLPTQLPFSFFYFSVFFFSLSYDFNRISVREDKYFAVPSSSPPIQVEFS